MKSKDLDKELQTLSGSQIMLTPTKALTYRSAMVSACETFTGEPGSGDTLKAYNVGLKILNAKEDTVFEKEDVDFLISVINNSRTFMAVVVGRLLDFINKN